MIEERQKVAFHPDRLTIDQHDMETVRGYFETVAVDGYEIVEGEIPEYKRPGYYDMPAVQCWVNHGKR
jgi:hypothetical protein